MITNVATSHQASTGSYAHATNTPPAPEGFHSILLDKMQGSEQRVVSVDFFEESLKQLKSYVEKLAGVKCRDLGIDGGAEMKFSVGYDGTILVNGQEPEAGKLAQAINEDEELANSIRGMSATASLLEAARRHQEFAAAYEREPLAAVEQYGYLLEDGHDYHVTFTMAEGKVSSQVQYI